MSQQKNIKILQKVAKKLKEIREQKGLSQQEVYDDTDIHIARIEATNLNITIITLSKLCEYYEVTLNEFFQKFN